MDGVIVINKSLGCTSFDIVRQVKKIFGKKVGHTGTLDPMAEGVLPILIGKGTLISKYLINHDKTYVATLTLGKKTDTADSEGKVLCEEKIDGKMLEKDFVESKLKGFLGKQKQIQPIYSAIKVNGKKLYEYARKNEDVEIKPRDIEIYDIKLLKIEEQNITFKCSCSKGTYIRSLCEDIAESLGTIGYMSKLIREKVGEFEIKDAITIQELQENFNNRDFWDKYFISIESLFQKCNQVILDDNRLKHFLNGVKITVKQEDGLYRIYNNQSFIGLGKLENHLLKRDIIL